MRLCCSCCKRRIGLSSCYFACRFGRSADFTILRFTLLSITLTRIIDSPVCFHFCTTPQPSVVANVERRRKCLLRNSVMSARRPANRRQRAEIAGQTVEILQREAYTVAGATVSLSGVLAAIRDGTMLYTPAQLESLFSLLRPNKESGTSISVVNCTTLSAYPARAAGVKLALRSANYHPRCKNSATFTERKATKPLASSATINSPRRREALRSLLLFFLG